MRASAIAAEVLRSPETQPSPEPRSGPRVELGDLRFRALMTEADWASLPLAIRRRFSKRLAGGQTIVYAGEILESRMSRGLVARPGRASHWRSFAAGARHPGPKRTSAGRAS